MLHSLYKLSPLFIIIMLVFCGCWDRRETEELLLVDAIVFDLVEVESELKYQISFISTKSSAQLQQMGMSQEGGGGEQWIATIVSDSIEEAFRIFNTRSTRYDYFPHNKMIIIGEKLAREGFSEILDYLIRKEGIRLRNNILISKGMVINHLEAKPEFENTIARELDKVLFFGSKQSDYFDRIDLSDFVKHVITPGLDAWSPVINSIDVITPKLEETSRAILVHNTALFKSDKLVDFLNNEETQAFLVLNRKGKQGKLKNDTDGKRIVYSYNSVKTHKKFESSKDKISVMYTITFKGIIEEINYNTEFTDQEIKKLENLFSNEAQKLMFSTILKLQKSGSDVLGIGRMVHMNNPSLWKELKDNWDELYQDVNITVKVKTHITGTDLVRKPITESTKGR